MADWIAIWSYDINIYNIDECFYNNFSSKSSDFHLIMEVVFYIIFFLLSKLLFFFFLKNDGFVFVPSALDFVRAELPLKKM